MSGMFPPLVLLIFPSVFDYFTDPFSGRWCESAYRRPWLVFSIFRQVFFHQTPHLAQIKRTNKVFTDTIAIYARFVDVESTVINGDFIPVLFAKLN